MKQVKHYVCEICGTEYNDVEACRVCERSHKEPKTITKTRHLAVTQDKSGYPVAVDVLFSDGTTKTYKR